VLDDSRRVLGDIVKLINQFGTLKMKMRATLYLIYFHSIHNRFTDAKDLLLKSHIGDVVYLQDIGIQILYNRAVTQCGMAAFRAGNIEEAHDILVDICQIAKLKEILA
jgi:translation initiation factor 3 subunit C